MYGSASNLCMASAPNLCMVEVMAVIFFSDTTFLLSDAVVNAVHAVHDGCF